MTDRWIRLFKSGIWSYTAVEGQSPYWHGKIQLGSDGFWDVWDNRYHVMYGGSLYPPGDIVMDSAKTISGPDNLLLSLDTSRTVPGSTDYALYEAILALGWENDVID